MRPERNKFFQRSAAEPKSSVASVSEIKLVLMATEAKLSKAVVAPVLPLTQVPSMAKQPSVRFKPLAKVEVAVLLSRKVPEVVILPEVSITNAFGILIDPEVETLPDESTKKVPEALVAVLLMAKALAKWPILP